jgi:hypothetical protein
MPRSSIFRSVIDNEGLAKPAGKTKVWVTVYTLGLPAIAVVLELRFTVTALAGAHDRATNRKPNPIPSLRKRDVKFMNTPMNEFTKRRPRWRQYAGRPPADLKIGRRIGIQVH